MAGSADLFGVKEQTSNVDIEKKAGSADLFGVEEETDIAPVVATIPKIKAPDDEITQETKKNIQNKKIINGFVVTSDKNGAPIIRSKAQQVLEETGGERSAIQGFKKKNIAANDELAKIYKTPEGQTILTTNALLKKQYNDIVDIQKTLESDQVAPEQKASFQKFYEKQVAIYNQTKTNLKTALDTKPELKEKYEKAI